MNVEEIEARIRQRRHERTGLDYAAFSLKRPVCPNVWVAMEDAIREVREYEKGLGYEPAS